MKENLEAGLHCCVDQGATVVRIGLVRRSGAALGLMLVTWPILRNDRRSDNQGNRAVADRGFGLQIGCVARGFSCGETDGLPAHGESRTTEQVDKVALAGSERQRRAQLLHLFMARQSMHSAGGLSDIRSQNRKVFSPLGTPSWR
jgi:hypothetical protein